VLDDGGKTDKSEFVMMRDDRLDFHDPFLSRG
jgi:hypothetical protein